MPDTITQAGGLGAAITPEEWAGFVLDHLTHSSVVLRSGATEIRTEAKKIHVPRLTGDGSVDWYDELEDIEGDAPDGNDLELAPKKVANLVTLGNESVDDSDPNVLDTVGMAMVRAIALESDRAIFTGEGDKQPVGILVNDEVPLPDHDGNVDYEGLVRAAGKVRQEGGEPDAAYISPLDYTELQLQEDGENRPLISGDPTDGPPPVIAGLRVYQSPAFDPGEALVGEAKQIVVAVRKDATVRFSGDSAFGSDATQARVIARLDAGVNDSRGLCTIGFGGS